MGAETKAVETGYHNLNADSKHEDWQATKADFHVEEDGRGEVLNIDGHPVMEQWEQPYMAALAKIATSKGGRVLEVGFGLGLSATAIQQYDIEEHVIIEANSDVVKRGEEWAKDQPHKVVFKEGLWQDVVDSLPENYLDGVLYDPYPLNSAEQHIHQFDFIKKIYAKMKPGSILTYCNLTSIGVLKGQHAKWENLWKQTQVPHIIRCGFQKFSFSTFKITAPDTCEYYAGHTEALLPKLERPALRKARYLPLEKIRRGYKNVNVRVKVTELVPDKRIAFVGDDTATIKFSWSSEVATSKAEKPASLKVGDELIIRNATCKGSGKYRPAKKGKEGEEKKGDVNLSLICDRWGKLDFDLERAGIPEAFGDVKMDNPLTKPREDKSKDSPDDDDDEVKDEEPEDDE